MHDHAGRPAWRVIPIAPLDHRDKHGQKLSALGGDSVLVAPRARLVGDTLQDPIVDETRQALRKHVSREAEALQVVVEAPPGKQ